MNKNITPKGVTDLLYQFEDVKGIAMGHVIANGTQDNLYVVLVRVEANESSTADFAEGQVYSSDHVDVLDQDVSGHLMSLLRHPIAFDGCSGGLSKPHCAGPIKNCRRRQPDVPRDEERLAAEADHTLPDAEPFLSSAVPAERLNPIFDVMDRLSFHGFGKCKPKH